MAVSFQCFSCGNLLNFSSLPGRRDLCPKCHSEVHVCKNCKHYDAKAYNECREPQAEVVLQKDRANFCDFFTPTLSSFNAQKQQNDLRAAAEALFKKRGDS